MILAILNLCLALMPPIKFQLNPLGLGGEDLKMANMAAILDIGME